MSNDQCIEKMPGLIISEFMICASMPGTNKDACQVSRFAKQLSCRGLVKIIFPLPRICISAVLS